MAAEKARHAISVFFDRDTLCMEAVCHAEIGARCRLVCDHECESWSEPYEVNGVWRHDIEGYSGNVIATHGMRDAGYCNVVEFINNGDAEECAHPSVGRIDLATVPIKPVWEGDYYQCRPLSAPPGQGATDV